MRVLCQIGFWISVVRLGSLCGFGFHWRGFAFGWWKQLDACIIMRLIEVVRFGGSVGKAIKTIIN